MAERKKPVTAEKSTPRSPSNAELDLERRTEDGYVPESATHAQSLNPNPFGEGAYVGTDPIYQNSSTDANKAFDSKSGVEKKVNDAYKKEHKLDEDAVADSGLGGKAEVAEHGAGARSFRTLLPGQEGYDQDKADEAQQGSPQRVYNDES